MVYGERLFDGLTMTLKGSHSRTSGVKLARGKKRATHNFLYLLAGLWFGQRSGALIWTTGKKTQGLVELCKCT